MTEKTSPPLVLKRGWTYRNRQGEKRTIVEEVVDESQRTHSFQDSIGLTYSPDGHVFAMDSVWDLVEELFECHGLDNEKTVHFYEQDFYVLSNFSSFTLNWKGIRFDTAEAAYHWEKFAAFGKPAEIRERIRVAASAHEAFQLAQEYKGHRRPDWDDIKVGIMEEILREKVRQHSYVKRKLLATGDRHLVENSWRDDFWGWGPDRNGQNVLGKLWMKIRSDLSEPPMDLPDFLKVEEEKTIMIKAPLPAGIEDTPEVRAKMVKFLSNLGPEDF